MCACLSPNVNGTAGYQWQPDTRPHEAIPPAAPSRSADRFRAAQAAPQAAICRHCGRRKMSHGKLAFSCLPTEGVARGQMFEAVDEEKSLTDSVPVV